MIVNIIHIKKIKTVSWSGIYTSHINRAKKNTASVGSGTFLFAYLNATTKTNQYIQNHTFTQAIRKKMCSIIVTKSKQIKSLSKIISEIIFSIVEKNWSFKIKLCVLTQSPGWHQSIITCSYQIQSTHTFILIVVQQGR